MATANVQISNWTSVGKKSFQSLERILWIWNTVSQGKTNLSGIGSLKPCFVASQSPFLCLFDGFCFFSFFSWAAVREKTLRKSKGNNSCNLDVSSTKISSSKIKGPFKIIPLGQWLWRSNFPLPSTCKGLCDASCAWEWVHWPNFPLEGTEM